MPEIYGPLRLIALVLCADSCPVEASEAGIYVISGELSQGFTQLPFYAVTRLNPVAGVQDSEEESSSIIRGLELLREAIAAHINANAQMHAFVQKTYSAPLLSTHVYFHNARHRSGKITTFPRNI